MKRIEAIFIAVFDEKRCLSLHSIESAAPIDMAVLSRFGRAARGRTAYRRYVKEAIRCGLAESPLEEVKAGFVLGGEEFLEGARKRIKGDVKGQPASRQLRNRRALRTLSKPSAAANGKSGNQFVRDWGGTWCCCLREGTP